MPSGRTAKVLLPGPRANSFMASSDGKREHVVAIEIERIDRPTDDVRALVTELEAELAGQYEAHQRHGLSLDRIFQPNIAFFIVRLDGAAVGCGGIAFDSGFAELKRMYVRPAVRGNGVAQALIEKLEAEARTRGYARLTLETGDVLNAAMRLYQRSGFRPCAAFGDYTKLPAANIERSRFFEKHLTPPEGTGS